MPGRPRTRERLAAARAGAAGVLDPATAAVDFPPGSTGAEIGARAAVAALVRADGNVIEALRTLGMDVQAMSVAELQAAALRTFQRERVKELLLEGFDDVEQQKPKLLARMVDIALHGSDEAAVRAFISLSKVAGWVAATKHEISAKSINIHTLLSDPRGVQAALEQFGHEPGEALAIEDEVAKLGTSIIEGEIVGGDGDDEADD